MKILIDVNLSVEWAEVLKHNGFDAVNWRDVGDPTAPDTEIMAWARERGYTILTQDLDFGTLLALTRQTSPSVLTMRLENSLPRTASLFVLNA
jgi:predicted nuclease of predicted toxin-antitoxin system